MSEISRDDYSVCHRLRVRYSEIDAQGVVFNAHYLTYFDTALNEAFRDADVDWLEKAHESGCDVQLVRSLVEYKSSIRFDEEIDICARVARLGNSSITWHLAVIGVADDSLRATGEIVWVYSDLKKGQSATLPDWLRNTLENL